MRVSRSTLFAVLILTMALAAPAQEPPAVPTPTAEHAVLEMWVGDWAGSGEMKPGPFGPGGPMSWTESCSWFGGSEFHVVCESEGTGPMGDMKGLGIVGYNPEKGVYTHYGIDSSGWTGHAEGNREGETWTFQSEETMGGDTFYSRFSMTMESPTTMTFSWEMSQDGKTWMEMMVGKSVKKK